MKINKKWTRNSEQLIGVSKGYMTHPTRKTKIMFGKGIEIVSRKKMLTNYIWNR